MSQPRMALPLAALAFLGLSITTVQAACPQRLGINIGDTVESVALACGISVERLRSINPGLNFGTLQAGTFINIPRPVLPSPQMPLGRSSVKIAPPLIPTPNGPSPSSTVIAPLPPPVMHRFDMPGIADPVRSPLHRR